MNRANVGVYCDSFLPMINRAVEGSPATATYFFPLRSFKGTANKPASRPFNISVAQLFIFKAFVQIFMRLWFFNTMFSRWSSFTYLWKSLMSFFFFISNSIVQNEAKDKNRWSILRRWSYVYNWPKEKQKEHDSAMWRGKKTCNMNINPSLSVLPMEKLFVGNAEWREWNLRWV